jgi:hypothetical protein
MATRLDSFSSSCLDIITSKDTNHHLMQGYIVVLALVFKLAPRLDVVWIAMRVIKGFQAIVDGTRERNAVLRKLVEKLGTRAGLACLKPRVASWRYDRGIYISLM